MQWTDPIVLGRYLLDLDEARFAELMNALLSETAAKNGIDRSCIATNLNTKERDGGIDARCVNAPRTAGRLIPRSNVDYQYKSGAYKKSLEKIIKEDIKAKPRVMDGLGKRHAFVFLAAADKGDATEDNIAAKLKEEGITVEDGQVIFITGDTIVRLLQSFPGLVARHLSLDMPLYSLEEWSRFRSLSNPFVVDEELQKTIDNLRAEIEKPGSRTRIVGAAGDGKTRTVMEALRASTLAPSVLYAKQVAEVTHDFLAHLRRTRDIECTLIIDEVDDANADTLRDRFSDMPPGVRLVMIGLDASGRAQRETLQIEGLDEDLLSEAIRALVPGLAEEIARSIARDCHRSPKLAVLIAGRIKENPGLASTPSLLADGEILSALDRYLDIDPASPSWRALSVTALLMRLGWSEEMEKESEILFRAVGLDPIEARQHVERLHDRYGIAPAANRLRYVSPAILADHLAARQLNSWTRERLEKVFAELTPAMADSFGRRVRRMAMVLNNRRVVEEVILGDQGPFRTLTDLESSHLAVLLRRLAAPFPLATLAALRRVIDLASIEELRAATRSRRDLVWALEELLWREDTFEAAADLLLRLALAENENLGNNASQIWVSTFQTMLGRTAAGSIARARVIRRAATSPDPAARRLAAGAIGAALKSEHLHRSGMPPSDVAGMPAEEWRPATYGEWADAVVSYLDILAPLLADTDVEVRRSAAEALGAGLNTASTLPERALWQWVTVVRTLVGSDYDLREPVLNAIEWTRNRLKRLLMEPIKGGASDISSAQEPDTEKAATIKKRLDVLASVAKELRGEDFSSRFRLTLTSSIRGAVTHEDREEQQRAINSQLEDFAKEAVSRPELLEGEWGWLLNDKKWRGAERWIEVLGRVDEGRVFTPALTHLALQSPRASMWLSLYELAHAHATQDPTYIDRRIAEMRAQSMPPGQVFDLLYRAGYQPARFSLMLELFESAAVPADYINNLAYHPWGPKLSASEALRLAEAAAAHTSNLELLIPFVSNYLSQVTDAKQVFSDFAIKLLLTPVSEQAQARPADEWVDLAHIYVDQFPSQLAAAALQRMIAYKLFYANEYEEKVLKRAWELGDKEQLFTDVFAPWIISEEIGGWHVRQELQGFPFADLGTEYLVNWVAVDPENRAHQLADVIGPPVGRPSDLHVELLEKFGAFGVGNSFWARFMSGSFVGPTSQWIRGKLKQAKQWLFDERPAVREWAQGLVRSLEADLQRELARESEEPLLY